MRNVDYAAELECDALRDLPQATLAAREIRACKYPFPKEALLLVDALDRWVAAGRPEKRPPYRYVLGNTGPMHPFERIIQALLLLYTVRLFSDLGLAGKWR